MRHGITQITLVTRCRHLAGRIYLARSLLSLGYSSSRLSHDSQRHLGSFQRAGPGGSSDRGRNRCGSASRSFHRKICKASHACAYRAGIGLMIATALENNGATVYIVGRRAEALEEAVRERSVRHAACFGQAAAFSGS